MINSQNCVQSRLIYQLGAIGKEHTGSLSIIYAIIRELNSIGGIDISMPSARSAGIHKRTYLMGRFPHTVALSGDFRWPFWMCKLGGDLIKMLSGDVESLALPDVSSVIENLWILPVLGDNAK